MEFKILSTWYEIDKCIIQPYLNNNVINNNVINNNVITNNVINSNVINKIKKINKKEYLDINQRLNFIKYQNLDNISCQNTINYVFNKIRSGIFIYIKNNKLEAFIPFANKYFINNWHNNIKLYSESKSHNLKNFISTKKKYIKYNKDYIYDIKKWWVNAYIINNEQFTNVWGQHSLKEYYEIINETLQKHIVNDCFFIINKRDHPILHGNLLEPYPNMYKKNNTPIIEKKYQYDNFIPILSPYTNKYYLDIPFIIPQDWQLANSDSTYYKIEHTIKWKDKIPTALFRGSATGSMELKYNQRLHISKIDNEWKNTKPGLLDAGIVSWNSKDKIDSNLQINYIKPQLMNKLGIYLKQKIPMNEQIKYKYIINIDGHSKPNRTSYLLQSGSLILMVESHYVMGNICWYDELLKPYIHYIPIKYDLSDLEKQILWCRNNDNKCKQIVQNAKKLYNKYFNKDHLLKYCAYLFNQISNNFKD